MELDSKLNHENYSNETDLEKKLKIAEYLKSDEYSSDDDDGGSVDKPKSTSVLKIMIEKQEAIEKTVSLLKKEIVHSLPLENEPGVQGENGIESKTVKSAIPISNEPINANKTTATIAQQKPVKEEFDHLNNLLSDNKVQEMIRVVGLDTQNVIDRAMGAINSSKTIEDKRTAFSLGLRKLQMNLQTKKDVGRNSNYNFAMNLVGLKEIGSRK